MPAGQVLEDPKILEETLKMRAWGYRLWLHSTDSLARAYAGGPGRHMVNWFKESVVCVPWDVQRLTHASDRIPSTPVARM